MEEMLVVGHSFELSITVDGGGRSQVGDYLELIVENRDVARMITLFRPMISKVWDEDVVSVEVNVPRIASWKVNGIDVSTVEVEALDGFLIAQPNHQKRVLGISQVEVCTVGAPMFDLCFSLSEIAPESREIFSGRIESKNVVAAVAIEHEEASVGEGDDFSWTEPPGIRVES